MESSKLPLEVFIHGGARRNYQAAMRVGGQMFFLCDRRTKREAAWFVRQFKKALANAGVKYVSRKPERWKVEGEE